MQNTDKVHKDKTLRNDKTVDFTYIRFCIIDSVVLFLIEEILRRPNEYE